MPSPSEAATTVPVMAKLAALASEWAPDIVQTHAVKSYFLEACDTATLVEIITEDRPGLLYSLATVFSSAACNIDVVLINTKGTRAIDVFYVAHQGAKLTPEIQATLKERLLAAC